MIDYKNKKFWIKHLIVAGLIVLVSPVLTNLLNTIFSFGTTWSQFVSILTILSLTELFGGSILKWL